MESTELKDKDYVALLSVAYYIRDNEPEVGCWPSHGTIGDRGHMTRGTARVALERVADAHPDILTITKGAGPVPAGGGKRTHVYRLPGYEAKRSAKQLVNDLDPLRSVDSSDLTQSVNGDEQPVNPHEQWVKYGPQLVNSSDHEDLQDSIKDSSEEPPDDSDEPFDQLAAEMRNAMTGPRPSQEACRNIIEHAYARGTPLATLTAAIREHASRPEPSWSTYRLALDRLCNRLKEPTEGSEAQPSPMT